MNQENDFSTPGFEDLEISTQIVIKEALSRGVEVEVLNRPSNFIRLRKGDHIELVQQGSKTRLDDYITFLVMENKAITKILLEENDIRIPKGEQYSSAKNAISDYEKYSDKSVVLKPTTTNMGIGISFLKKPYTESEYRLAIENTFKFDDTILVEEFIEGEEYRFIVMGYETAGVCQRVPANVIGDGESTISQLVELKNQDIRRGEDHNKPLEKILLSEVELEELADSGLTVESIPEKGEQVFLRKNSNISTGGDSYDRTDEIHPGYLRIAEEAAKVIGSPLTGVDLMIEDISAEPNLSNYAIIELNFNPVLYIHDFPYQGKNRRVGAKVLDLLGY